MLDPTEGVRNVGRGPALSSWLWHNGTAKRIGVVEPRKLATSNRELLVPSTLGRTDDDRLYYTDAAGQWYCTRLVRCSGSLNNDVTGPVDLTSVPPDIREWS